MILFFPILVFANEVWTIPVMTCKPCEEKIQLSSTNSIYQVKWSQLTPFQKHYVFKRKYHKRLLFDWKKNSNE